ncbi:bifunctional methylenetetrahydrofolate dehydrogenase/methenyltetrahydrofolate cyclohydrolase FolD [Paraburkholderia sp. CNPSo 3076]|uniref:bifunctional 5,10-methylenetetrahydrofolate dehydrogenase/5,10-methenyltetrahydrofolate cyclohydrolase n=1 Tax=Paraburkholderia sp. CNPSo 3076 TaxID=2940936 RepID=UPI002252B207|nr:bifunctional methylenetetrahydrofolate dehydrogenase/methenyltetrahydrofolate cyclohydrolase FolD [Paraburkholderia sp. CNPSo 3076]MCX5544075.1 bifunctional methylenetetrahydrofolate dehydrogenase/methenyltetrahydrofolate cyclohydrolase FolD [Paraburkholderia sp. CNPSo 3076]
MNNHRASSLDQPLVIDGVAAASNVVESIKARVQAEKLRPGLAVVLVGSDPASSVYVRNKKRRAEECGFLSRQYDLPEATREAELLALIRDLNQDPEIHGILVQLPLPPQINPNAVIDAIAPSKDVDGFHYSNAGRLGTGDIEQAIVPCTPLGCLHLLKQVLGDGLRCKHAVVIGRSNIVGKPMANLLMHNDCTVTIVHSRTVDPQNICRQADIVVAAVGIPKLVKADWIKEGAVAIDVGINRVTRTNGASGLVGDIDYDNVLPLTRAITPVPGGVGPMTIAMLMLNTLNAAVRSNQPAAMLTV